MNKVVLEYRRSEIDVEYEVGVRKGCILEVMC